MNKDEWKKRISQRSDMTTGLVHLTKKNDELSGLQVLVKILEERKLKGSTTKSGFVCGDIPAVCLQDTPLYSLAQNVYYEENLIKDGKIKKARYKGIGIRFRKEFIYKNGGRPVIYDNTNEAKSYLPRDEWWRIVKLDLNDEENIVDWTHEREWRVPGELEFELSDISIIVPNYKIINKIVKYYSKNGIDILKEVESIINLGHIFY